MNNALGVFWAIYQWREGEGESFPPDPSIGVEPYREIIQEIMDNLFRPDEVPYVPDRDDSENFEHLLIHLHIAGARALRSRNGNELSEEVIDCYREVNRSYRRISRMPSWGRYVFESEIHPSVLISTLAVTAMSYAELSRLQRREGECEEAFKGLFAGIALYEDALWNIRLLDKSGEAGAQFLEEEISRQTSLTVSLTGLEVSLHEIAGLFCVLQANSSEVSDWIEVSRICEALSQFDSPGAITGYDDVVENPWSEIETTYLAWSEFWSYAKGWSQERLSRSNYRKIREDDESTVAESHLKKHFHGYNSWDSLPDRTRRHLVNAYHLFHSTQKGALEAILNDLLIASEEMFNAHVWVTLSTAEWYPGLDAFEERKASPKVRGCGPGIADFVWVCRQPLFRKYLGRCGVDDQETLFLTEYLPTDLEKLRCARNSSQHEIGHVASRDDVESYFRSFIGIGQTGFLPTFHRIGRKLHGS